MRFDREREQPARHKYTTHLAQHGCEFADINHGVGGENQIGTRLRPAPQRFQHVADVKLCIQPGQAGLTHHAPRQIDADEMIDLPGKGGRGKAPKIEKRVWRSLSLEMLRAHVTRGPRDFRGTASLCVAAWLRETEVDELRRESSSLLVLDPVLDPIHLKDDVLRLHIAMNNTAIVRLV